MPPSSSIGEQVENRLAGARLRVLIVGAGIAGSTLGALLRQRGEPAAIIERADAEQSGGYMLGILPLGGRVLNGLELHSRFVSESTSADNYVLYGRHGQRIRSYAFGPVVDQFGDYRSIERGPLVNMLREKAQGIVYDASVAALRTDDRQTRVTFSDGSRADVDLVVAADGVHSHTRSLVVASKEVEIFDSGWAGWIAWGDLDPGMAHTFAEVWGDDYFVGMYPVPGRLGLFFGGPVKAVRNADPRTYAQRLRASGLPQQFKAALGTIDRHGNPVFWPMADKRSKVWSRRRVVLLGDAASSFLPTAGVGASAAMDAAAALSDELSRADRDHLDFALSLYERRQRHRTDAAQRNSRRLSKFMFRSGPITVVRDAAARFYTLEMFGNEIEAVMQGK